jgi:hypothetical protein
MARRDAGEFAAFLLASQPRLRRTAYLMCGDWSLASDFVQEALIRVYRHWPRLHGGQAHAYARQAVVSVVIDAKRRWSSTEVPVDVVAGYYDDLSGRRLVRVTGSPAFHLSFAGDTLLFQGAESLLRYDLVTGTLSRLNAPTPSRSHDKDCGYVAKIPD